MDVNFKAKDLDAELDKLASFYESGNGYGSPEGELEHQRKFQLLMHRQNLRVKKFKIFGVRVKTISVVLTLASSSAK